MSALHAFRGPTLLFPVEATRVAVGDVDVTIGLENGEFEATQHGVEQLPARSLFNFTAVGRMWTCRVGFFGGTRLDLLGAYASALQQSLERAVVAWRRHAAQALGTAQRVNPARLP